jgi:hypothetical protein
MINELLCVTKTSQMKRKLLSSIFLSFTFIFVSWNIYTNSDIKSPCDAPVVGGHTGAPGETSCTGCHGGSDNTGPATLTFNIGGGISEYVPGQVYSCTVGIAQSGVDKMGFSCLALKDADNTTIGAFALSESLRTRTYADGNRNYVSHKPCAADAATVGVNQWTFDWQAPATNVGNITLYLGALASNHNHATTGDSPYTRSVSLTPSLLSGLSEIPEVIKNVTIYPNPSFENFTLSFNNLSSNKVEIALHDLRGKRIKVLLVDTYKVGLIKETLSIKELGIEPGIYFLKILVNTEQLTQKLIIN